jgi:hypothetical protein
MLVPKGLVHPVFLAQPSGRGLVDSPLREHGTTVAEGSHDAFVVGVTAPHHVQVPYRPHDCFERLPHRHSLAREAGSVERITAKNQEGARQRTE